MSMHTYPLYEPAALLIDEHTAAYIVLQTLIKDDELDSETRALIDEHGIETVICKDLLPEDIRDLCSPDEAMEILSKTIDTVGWANEFDGTAEILWPERCTDPHVDIFNFGTEFIVFISASRCPDLFSQAYGSPEELRDEFKEKMKGHRPEDFPFWNYIVSINGTYFC